MSLAVDRLFAAAPAPLRSWMGLRGAAVEAALTRVIGMHRASKAVQEILVKVDRAVHGRSLSEVTDKKPIVLSRSHPKFLTKLFEAEVPEMAQGQVKVKAVVREPGSRAKIAVHSIDEHVDPVGALVGQRGVRVAVVTSELGGEKIDVVEWSENASDFVKEALKPAQILSIELHEGENRAVAQVADDQQSLAIGRGGQNVRLAARLTGWKIDIRSMGGEEAPEEESAFEVTKKEIAGDDSESADAGEENLDPVAQDRDIASEVVEEQQGEPVEKEADAE
jgi:N utilization substance protein A